MPRWEYLTWDTTDTKSGRSLRAINGKGLEEYRPEYPDLAAAGEQGWELIAVVPVGGSKIGSRHEYTLYFKRLREPAV